MCRFSNNGVTNTHTHRIIVIKLYEHRIPLKHTYTHTHIYMYIYLLINYLPVFTVPEKNKKPWPGTREKNISNHGPEEKEKKFFG